MEECGGAGRMNQLGEHGQLERQKEWDEGRAVRGERWRADTKGGSLLFLQNVAMGKIPTRSTRCPYKSME